MNTSPDKYLGQTLEGRYTIVNIIGVGGMATVYGAYDRVSGRSVAIKILNKKLEQNPEQIKLFINESTALSLLSHPNIVMVYNTAITNSIKYFVMEYVEGITLKSHIEQRGALPEREILYYSSQILSALDYIHSKSIIHCDIKPQNIILLQNGNIKVADFGISRVSSILDSDLEKSDTAIGTVYYISPEQAQGKLPRKESDIYSLGVMLYELATGTLPFNHENPTEVAKMQISKEPVPPSAYRTDLSVGLEQVILRAMEKDPSKRYSSAAEMLFDINALRRNSKTVFGGDKNSKYRIINRKAYGNPPNVSLTRLSLTGERNAHSSNLFSVFKTGSKQKATGTEHLTAETQYMSESRQSAAYRTESRSGTLPTHHNTSGDTLFIDPAGDGTVKPAEKKRSSPLAVLIGMIAALAVVVIISLIIWNAIIPKSICKDAAGSITRLYETEAIWNTEHTEKY